MLLQQVQYEPAPSPRRFNPYIPKDLDTICLKCLEKDPRKRYTTSRELVEDLESFLQGRAVKARAVGPLGRFWRWFCLSPRAMSLSAGVYLTVIAILLILWSVCGFANILAGIHPIEQPRRAVFELLAVLLFAYCPMLAAGLLVLNNRPVGLWLGCVWTAGTNVVLIGLNAKAAHFEILRLTNQSLYAQIQLFSLLALICTAGTVLTMAAIVARYVRR